MLHGPSIEHLIKLPANVSKREDRVHVVVLLSITFFVQVFLYPYLSVALPQRLQTYLPLLPILVVSVLSTIVTCVTINKYEHYCTCLPCFCQVHRSSCKPLTPTLSTCCFLTGEKNLSTATMVAGVMFASLLSWTTHSKFISYELDANFAQPLPENMTVGQVCILEIWCENCMYILSSVFPEFNLYGLHVSMFIAELSSAIFTTLLEGNNKSVFLYGYILLYYPHNCTRSQESTLISGGAKNNA